MKKNLIGQNSLMIGQNSLEVIWDLEFLSNCYWSEFACY